MNPNFICTCLMANPKISRDKDCPVHGAKFKLNKQEGKIKEMPGMEKPDVKTTHFSDYQQAIEDYNKRISSLKSYDIEISDWEGIEDGQEVGEFVLAYQVHDPCGFGLNGDESLWFDTDKSDYKTEPESTRRIIARPKPSVKEKIEVEFCYMFPYGKHKGGAAYNLSSPIIIPEEKLPLIKEAIEKILNMQSSK